MTAPNAGKGADKLDHSYIADENINWYTLENSSFSKN